jgi:hypothetical protein
VARRTERHPAGFGVPSAAPWGGVPLRNPYFTGREATLRLLVQAAR